MYEVHVSYIKVMDQIDAFNCAFIPRLLCARALRSETQDWGSLDISANVFGLSNEQIIAYAQLWRNQIYSRHESKCVLFQSATISQLAISTIAGRSHSPIR
jgi:hypothetical protein